MSFEAQLIEQPDGTVTLVVPGLRLETEPVQPVEPAPEPVLPVEPEPVPDPEPVPATGVTMRLQFGSHSETGAPAGSLQNLDYTVFLDESRKVVVQTGVLSLNPVGVGFIDVPDAPWAAGEYVLVMLATYDAALAPWQRTVRVQLGFVPAVAA